MGLGASARDLVRVIEESIADTLIDAKQRAVTGISLEDHGGEIHAIPAG
jgi:hypothetical protein